MRRELLLLSLTIMTACQNRTGFAEDNQANGTVHQDMYDHDDNGVNMLQAPSRLELLKQAAISGDNGAANDVANHYMQLGQTGEEIRWRSLAANRGDCLSLLLLRDMALDESHRKDAIAWNTQLRKHACTWDKAYPTRYRDSRPLWDEELGN